MTDAEAHEAGGTLRAVLQAQMKAVMEAAIELQPACEVEMRDNKPCLKCESIADLATQLDSAIAEAISAHLPKQTFEQWADGVEGALKDVFKKENK